MTNDQRNGLFLFIYLLSETSLKNYTQKGFKANRKFCVIIINC